MNPTLPTVSGRMEMTHADFQHACAVAIADLQDHVAPDNSLIHLLCEAIRCSREACQSEHCVRKLEAPMTTDEALKNVQDYVQKCREDGYCDLRSILSHIRFLREDLIKRETKEGDAPCPDATVTEGK